MPQSLGHLHTLVELEGDPWVAAQLWVWESHMDVLRCALNAPCPDQAGGPECNEGTDESAGADFWGGGSPRLSDPFFCSCTKRPAQDFKFPSSQFCPKVGKSCWERVTAQLGTSRYSLRVFYYTDSVSSAARAAL